MAIQDSALDYTATVAKINPLNGLMTVKYESVDSTDGRPPVFQNVTLLNTEYNDSGVQSAIQRGISRVVATWNQALSQDSDNPTFNDSAFVGSSFNLRYRLDSSEATPEFNPFTQKIVVGQSQTADYNVETFTVVQLDSDERVSVRNETQYERLALMTVLKDAGKLDSAISYFSDREIYHAAWDGSTAGSFDWANDEIASGGIKNVERLSQGTFRVHLATPQQSANYTVTTGVGNEDFSGAGASPRQVTLLTDQKTAEYFTVNCERTDDAVNEDNEYISVMMMPTDVIDSANSEWADAAIFYHTGPALKKLKTMLNVNDSDLAVILTGQGY